MCVHHGCEFISFPQEGFSKIGRPGVKNEKKKKRKKRKKRKEKIRRKRGRRDLNSK